MPLSRIPRSGLVQLEFPTEKVVDVDQKAKGAGVSRPAPDLRDDQEGVGKAVREVRSKKSV